MINENSLASELKAAYKYGYQLRFDSNEDIYIIANKFIVKTTREDIPRKVLGLIVEHIGYIPEDLALRCAKNMDNQTIIPETLNDLISTVGFGNGQRAIRTPLTYKGSTILFQKENKEIIGIDSDMLSLLKDPAAPIINTFNNRAIWLGKGLSNSETLYLMVPVLNSKDNVQLNHLEQFDWRIKDDER